jgi:hypothetical protein
MLTTITFSSVELSNCKSNVKLALPKHVSVFSFFFYALIRYEEGVGGKHII